MQDAQSDIKRLQKQYKDNKEELNKAMAAMYKEKGINNSVLFHENYY